MYFKASFRSGTLMVHSTWSTSTIEEVARCSPQGLKWYHMYFLGDDQENISRIQRAEKEGYKAIVITVDAPYRGKKYKKVGNLPPHLTLANLGSVMKLLRSNGNASGEEMGKILCNPAITWNVIPWLRSVIYWYRIVFIMY